MCQPYWLLGHTSNNLSLGPKSIGHKSKSHLLKIVSGSATLSVESTLHISIYFFGDSHI